MPTYSILNDFSLEVREKIYDDDFDKSIGIDIIIDYDFDEKMDKLEDRYWNN